MATGPRNGILTNARHKPHQCPIGAFIFKFRAGYLMFDYSNKTTNPKKTRLGNHSVYSQCSSPLGRPSQATPRFAASRHVGGVQSCGLRIQGLGFRDALTVRAGLRVLFTKHFVPGKPGSMHAMLAKAPLLLPSTPLHIRIPSCLDHFPKSPNQNKINNNIYG